MSVYTVHRRRRTRRRREKGPESFFGIPIWRRDKPGRPSLDPRVVGIMRDVLGWSVQKICKKLGVSRPTVSNAYKKWRALPEEERQRIIKMAEEQKTLRLKEKDIFNPNFWWNTKTKSSNLIAIQKLAVQLRSKGKGEDYIAHTVRYLRLIFMGIGRGKKLVEPRPDLILDFESKSPEEVEDYFIHYLNELNKSIREEAEKEAPAATEAEKRMYVLRLNQAYRVAMRAYLEYVYNYKSTRISGENVVGMFSHVFFTVPELKAIIGSVMRSRDEDYRIQMLNIIFALLHQGFRAEELVRLRVGDIDLERFEIKVATKTAKSGYKVRALNPAWVPYLMCYLRWLAKREGLRSWRELSPNQPLFPMFSHLTLREAKRRIPRLLRRVYEAIPDEDIRGRILEKLEEYDRPTHIWRHTFGNWYMRLTKNDAITVAKCGGWDKIDNVKVYARIDGIYLASKMAERGLAPPGVVKRLEKEARERLEEFKREFILSEEEIWRRYYASD